MKKKSSLGVNRPSKRQAEILSFIGKFQRQNGYSASLSEIASHFDVSIPTVHQHISYLKKKNLLLAPKGKRRGLQTFNDHKMDVVEIPLLGLIAAGGPIT